MEISDRIEDFTKMIEENEMILKSTAIHYFRKLFATERERSNIPDQSVFYPRIIRQIMDCLSNNDFDRDTHADAIWVVTNMCCLNQNINHMYVDAKCIDIMVKHLSNGDKKISNQCVWALANISADCIDCKTKCRSVKVFKKLVQKLSKSYDLSPVDRRNIIWCINNLTSGGRIQVPNSTAKSLIRVLDENLFNQKGYPTESASKVLWSLANIADDINNLSRIDMILDQPGLLNSCMNLFVDPCYPKLHTSALRLIGNIAVGNNEQTDRLLEFPIFQEVLRIAMSKPEHQSEIAWICSNVCAGLPRHIDYLLQNENFYSWVQDGIQSKERRYEKECLWVVANSLVSGDEAQMEWFVEQGVIFQIKRLLQNEDVRLNEKGLSAAIHILREYPWQKTLFEELKIPDCIHPDILTPESPPIFSAQKRELEIMMANEKWNTLKMPKIEDEYDILYFAPL